MQALLLRVANIVAEGKSLFDKGPCALYISRVHDTILTIEVCYDKVGVGTLDYIKGNR